jgi:hypothetical protein
MTLSRLNKTEVVKALSTMRLSPYQRRVSKTTEVLAAYEQNVRLLMALYPILQQFEVIFRNQIERILIADHGTQWYINPSFTKTLDSWATGELSKSIAKLKKDKKTIHSGAVVAESTFGFWTNFLSVHYNHTIWFPHDRNIFPFATTSQRTIKQIRQDFDTIRKLRNRVAHHEPIWHDPDLLLKYQSIMQLLGWMNPHVTLWLHRTKLDHFKIVHKAVYHPTTRKPRVKK